MHKLQVMPLRNVQPSDTVALVDIGRAILQHLDGRPQRSLAAAVGMHESRMSRLIRGRLDDIGVREINAIELALGLQPGDLLIAGGFVGHRPALRKVGAPTKAQVPPEQVTVPGQAAARPARKS